MARYYSDRLITGRLGNQVFCIRDGKTYVRAYVKNIKADSPKQRIQQARMKATVAFLRLFKPVITIGFQNPDNNGRSEFCRALQYHIHNALIESTTSTVQQPIFEVELNKAILAKGNIEQPQIETCFRFGNQIELSWDSSLGDSHNRYFDQMSIVAFTPGLKVLSNFNIGTRISGKGTFMLPEEYEEKVHLWVFYFSGQRKASSSLDHISNSVYLGEF